MKDPADVSIREFIEGVRAAIPQNRTAVSGTLVMAASPDLASRIQDSARKAEAEGLHPLSHVTDTLGSYLALYSTLTEGEAQDVVERAMSKLSGAEQDTLADVTVANKVAESISQELTLPTIGVTADMSKPVMLSATVRVTFGWLSIAALVGVILSVVFLGARPDVGAAAFVGLGIIGFLLVVALLVLVMGYGQVRMATSLGKSTEPPSSSSN